MLGAVVLIAGCARESGEAPGWAMAAVSLSTPAAPGSRYPNLAARPDGSAVLSWVAPATDGAHALQYSTWTG